MDLAQAATVVEAWPVGSLRRTQPISGGIDNVNIRVWTTAGKFVMTFYRDLAQLRTLQAISRHLGAHRFPVPQFLPTRSGAMWLKTPHGYAALTIHLPGKHPKKPISLCALRGLGSALGRLDSALVHYKPPLAFKPIDWSTLEARFRMMRTRDSELYRQLHPIYLRVRRALRPLLPHCRHSLIHNDYAEGNVLMRGSKVMAVLDFGDAEHSYLPADAGVAITHLCCLRGRAIPRAAGSFMNGYLAHMPLTNAERRAVFWFILKRGIDLTTYFWEQHHASISDHLGPKRMNREMVRWGLRSIDSWYAVGPETFSDLCRSEAE